MIGWVELAPGIGELDFEDLDDAIAHAEPAFTSLAGASLFITGGTGFIGRWLHEKAVDLLHESCGLRIVARDMHEVAVAGRSARIFSILSSIDGVI